MSGFLLAVPCASAVSESRVHHGLRARALLRLAHGAVAIAAIVLAVCAFVPNAAYAESGTVYSCTVHPVYEHPVTGEIEDSGGESSQATGQAMVESCVSGTGMMEVTDGGASYLTIRLSLMDLTSNHAFQVQGWGESGWSNPAMGVTATGSDANGTTNDVAIELPGEDGIVRVSMFVDSMGRDVVFYVYADGFSEGTPDGFTPTIVTEASPDASDEAASEAADEEPASDEPASDADASDREEGASDGDADEQAASSGDSAESGSGDWSTVELKSGESAASPADAASSNAASSKQSTSAASTSADETSEELVASAGGSSDQGLSLSTADDPAVVEAAGQPTAQPAFNLPGSDALLSIVALEVVILIPMVVAAFIVYLFRRNWKRWGGEDDDNYSKVYRDEML